MNACRSARPSLKKSKPQRGVALVTAMLIVVLSVMLIDYLLTQHQILFRLIEQQRMQAQAQQILDAGVNWARRILEEDSRNSAQDALSESWAIAMAPTPVNDIQTAQGSNQAPVSNAKADAVLSGKIEDAQARYNLRNLFVETVTTTGTQRTPNDKELATLRRIFTASGVSEGLVEDLSRALILPRTNGPLNLITVDDLRAVEGFTDEVIQKLRPVLVVLPSATPLNLNTASAMLIAARVEGLDNASAQRLVQERDRATLKDLADVSSRLPDKTLQLNPSEVSVSTQFFLLNGQVQYRDVTAWRTTLVARDAITTRLVWERPW